MKSLPTFIVLSILCYCNFSIKNDDCTRSGMFGSNKSVSRNSHVSDRCENQENRVESVSDSGMFPIW